MLVFAAGIVVGWAGLWWGTKIWGEQLLVTREMKLPAPPLAAFWDRRLNASFVLMGLSAAIGTWFLPLIAQRLQWAWAQVVAFWSTFVFSCVFAINDGWDSFLNPIVERAGYLNAIDKVESPGQFLRDYIDLITQVKVGIHVQGHPPGMVLVTWALDQLGFRSERGLAFLVVLGGAAAVVGVLSAVRCLVDEATARQALPFVALSPACLWIATSSDALFAGVTAWLIASFAFAVTSVGRASVAWSVVTGLLFFSALMLSYGFALFGLPLVVIAVWKRGIASFAIAMVTASLGLALVASQGFWWFEGLSATKTIYYDGVAGNRPYSYFLVANIAALGVSVGPMLPVAFAWLRDRRMWVLLGSFLAMVSLANLSGMSKAEVERIWLPFTMFLLAGGAAFWVGSRPLRTARIAMAIQLVFTVWLQTNVQLFW